MFDKFGEFDSYEEINRAAEAQFNEGDMEAIRVIAEENGIDKEDAEDFIAGVLEILTTPFLAAVGKLDVEAKDLELEGVLMDWKESILQLCDGNEDFCIAVRKRGKTLAGCLGEILKVSFQTKKQVNEKICKAAGLREGKRKDPVYMGIPNKTEVKRIVSNYYLG